MKVDLDNCTNSPAGTKGFRLVGLIYVLFMTDYQCSLLAAIIYTSRFNTIIADCSVPPTVRIASPKDISLKVFHTATLQLAVPITFSKLYICQLSDIDLSIYRYYYFPIRLSESVPLIRGLRGFEYSPSSFLASAPYTP